MGAYDEPAQECPYCKSECFADFVDVGIGSVQCSPYYCNNCGASEIGAYDSPRILTNEEKETGWYESNSPVSDKANTIDGVLVDHKTAKDLYEIGMLDSNKLKKNGKWIAHCQPCNKEFEVKSLHDVCPTCNNRKPEKFSESFGWYVIPRTPMSKDCVLRFEEF